MPRPSGGRGRREPCAKCGLPVFIAERLNVGKQLYHRTCFRCARCNSQLTLANYYETETENQFCCETCPDEEQIKQISDKDDTSLDEKSVLNRSLSDEEKSAGIQKSGEHDEYSCMFETALENSMDKGLSTNYTLSSEQSAEFTKARSRFITSQLVDSECDTSDDEAPELPKSEPPDLNSLKTNSELEFLENSENTELLKESKDFNSENISSIQSSEVRESCDSGFVPHSLDSLVYSSKVSDVSDKNQPETAVQQLDTNKIITKENKFPSDNSNGSSLVKSRMRLFENKVGDQSSNEEMKKCSVVKDITNKNAEKKFIHKVPLVEENDEERNCSTGLGSKSLVIKESESDNSINNSSLVDAVDNKNEENHTEQKQEEATKSAEDSIIVISSDTSKEDSVNKIPTESSNDVNQECPIIISDSSSNNQSKENKITLEETSPVIDISDSADNVISSKSKEEYPEDLNPFGDEDEQEEPPNKPIVGQSLNPFDEDDDVEIQKVSPKPAVRKKLKAKQSLISGKNEGTPEHLAQILIQRISYNPFDDDEDEEESKNETSSASTAPKVVPAPRISLNPFWSDGEEPEEEDHDKNKPIPLPRNSR